MTTCSRRRTDGPRHQASVAATSQTPSITAPRHVSAAETKRPAPSRSPVNPANPAQTSRWRTARRNPSASPSTRLGRVAEVVEQRAHVSRVVGQLVDERRHPHDHADGDGDDHVAVEPTRIAVERRVPALPSGEHERSDRQHGARQEVGHVGLGAQRTGHDQGHEHQRVAAQHRPGGEQHDEPGQQRQVGIPRLRQQQLPVPADRHGEQGGDAEDPAPAGPPMSDPQRRGDRRDVDRHRRRLQRPRRRPRAAGRAGRGGRS